MDKEDLLNINGNNKKDFKKILIYGAIVFLVFVIGVIAYAIYKNINQSKEETILPPQVKQESLFKQVPIEQKISNNNVSSKNQTSSLNQNTINSNVNLTKPTQSTNIKQKLLNEISKKEVTSSEINPIKKVKTKIEQPIKLKQQKIIKKYYIQVAALLKYKKPNKKFLELIEKYGYKYRFFTTFIKTKNKKIKVTKILIGPFTKKEAEKNLPKVKKYISQNAFIFKVR